MNGLVKIYYGEGKGKTIAAIGQAIRAASQGKSVIIIQFLKGKNDDEISFLKRLEPQIKLFRFEKSKNFYQELTIDEQQEEIMNIRNGICFAKKVLVTEECDVLILDEILGLVDNHIMKTEELKNLIAAKDENTELIMTGIHMDEDIRDLADEISKVTMEKSNVDKENH